MRPALTRAQIVATTRALVHDQGVDAVSLRRVAQSLGVTAPALYAHVTDKDDLLRAVAEEEFRALIERFEAVDATDPVDRMRAYGRAYVDHAREHPRAFRVMFLFPPELGAAAPRTGTELPAATKAFSLPAAAAVEAAEAGRFRPGTDPLLASLTAWSAFHGVAVVLQLGFAFGTETEDQLVDTMVQAVFDGLVR